jgi:hypothetical protein
MDYVERIRKVSIEQPVLLLAHAYTRYLGDLSGGQVLRIVAAKAMDLPASGEGTAFYRFDRIPNARDFKVKYRAALDAAGISVRLADAVAREASLAFLLNIRVFQEIGGGDVLPLPADHAPVLPSSPDSAHAAPSNSKDAVCPFAKPGKDSPLGLGLSFDDT